MRCISSLKEEGAVTHIGSSTRHEIDYLEHDAVGGFVDSITSTSTSAVMVVRLTDDLLVVAVEGDC